MNAYGEFPKQGPIVGRVVDPPEHPIMFSAPMVLAILAGRKSQTRRLIKAPRHSGPAMAGVDFPCPYGVPGHRLWVRETWYCDHFAVGDFEYTRKSSFIGKVLSDAECIAEWRGRDPEGAMMYYRADGEGHQQFEQFDPEGFAWRPSIFMPRWASRILLEVTEVRVERLQAISEEDARAEGFSSERMPARINGQRGEVAIFDPRRWFATLWDAINGKRAPWASNPWVWAVSFRRLEP